MKEIKRAVREMKKEKYERIRDAREIWEKVKRKKELREEWMKKIREKNSERD